MATQKSDQGELIRETPEALLKEAAVFVAFLANTTTSETNRVNAHKLLARIEAAAS